MYRKDIILNVLSFVLTSSLILPYNTNLDYFDMVTIWLLCVCFVYMIVCAPALFSFFTRFDVFGVVSWLYITINRLKMERCV